MENLVQNLDEILLKVQLLHDGYLGILSKNENLESEINDLKVEVESYKSEILTLKKEIEKKEESVIKSTLSPTNDKSLAEAKDSLSINSEMSNDKIKLQLDEFIEDIDQCIQIIQAKK
ncbi:MAG: hypothetical protein WAU01_08210 [Saprospiraceae bacterium]